MTKQALVELRDAVRERPSWGFRDEKLCKKAFPKKYDPVGDVMMAWAGSLDAAKQLHEAVLPGYVAGVSENVHGHGWYGWVQTTEDHFETRNPDPARAWLLAILEALIQMEDTNETP